MTEAEVEAAAKAKSQAKAESEANSQADSLVADENQTEVASPEEDAPKITEDAQASTEATPKSILSKEEELKLRQLMLDLRWLITEGYVTEYGDGRLFAPPPMPLPKPKVPMTKETAEKEVSKSQTTTQSDPEPEIVNSELETTAIIEDSNNDGSNNDATNTEAVQVEAEAETDADISPVKDVPDEGEK
jgi:hypothetical protein